jgi:hypothetical protein
MIDGNVSLHEERPINDRQHHRDEQRQDEGEFHHTLSFYSLVHSILPFLVSLGGTRKCVK